MADGQLTATAEAPNLTQAQVPGSYWELMNAAEQKMREAWIAGSSVIPDKTRATRLLNAAINLLDCARQLMS